MNLTPNSYILEPGDWDTPMVEIKAREYFNGRPSKWAIMCRGSCMSKESGDYTYEPQPSSRDNEFLNEFRFDSAEEALETHQKFHQPNT